MARHPHHPTERGGCVAVGSTASSPPLGQPVAHGAGLAAGAWSLPREGQPAPALIRRREKFNSAAGRRWELIQQPAPRGIGVGGTEVSPPWGHRGRVPHPPPGKPPSWPPEG